VPYVDHFSGPGDSASDFIGHGLRGVTHYALPAPQDGHTDLNVLRAAKAPVEALFAEPFDPLGRPVHAAGTFAPAPAPPPGAHPAPRLPRVGPGSARPVLSGQPGHADGVLLLGGDLSFWASAAGALRPLSPAPEQCAISGGYHDPKAGLLLACSTMEGAAEIFEGETGKVRARFPPVITFMGHVRERGYLPAPWHVFANPDAIAVASDGTVGIVRVPSVLEPSTVDDPAWFLAEGAPPIELAPWSTLELATSPACAKEHGGYRAIVQTLAPWISVDGALGFRRAPGTRALVRWSTSRVCLEAVEAGYRQLEAEEGEQRGRQDVEVTAVARFVGAAPGGGLVGTTAASEVRTPAKCTVE
jgi:hypothetical protein